MARSAIDLDDVIEVAPGRRVRVRLGPARTNIVRDWRGRIAVRNIETNRLSYIPEQRLQKCKEKQWQRAITNGE